MATQQLIHNYDAKGASNWHFATDDIGLVYEYFIMPHIYNPNTWQYFEQLSTTSNWEASKAEDFSRLISLLVGLLKSAKSKIFSHNGQDNQVSTLP